MLEGQIQEREGIYFTLDDPSPRLERRGRGLETHGTPLDSLSARAGFGSGGARGAEEMGELQG